MLEGLDAIDWAMIKDSHGTSASFPRWIRELISPDSEVRGKALSNLREYSNHQDTIYPITPYMPPFLAEILRSDSPADKADILSVLISYAEDAHPTNGRWEPDADVYETYGAAANARMDRTIEALIEDSNTFLELLKDGDITVREGALRLVILLICRAPSLGSAVRAHVEHEPLPEVLYKPLETFDEYVASAPTISDTERELYGQWLRRMLETTEDRRLRLGLVKPLALMQPDVLTEELVAVFVDAFRQPEIYSGLDAQDWHTGAVFREALERFRNLPREIITRNLIGVLSEVVYAEDAHCAAIVLLDAALSSEIREVYFSSSYNRSGPVYIRDLPDDYPVERPENVDVRTRWEFRIGYLYPKADQPLEVSSLTSLQHRAIDAVLSSPGVWQTPNNLLELYGLPAKREDARRYLQASQSG